MDICIKKVLKKSGRAAAAALLLILLILSGCGTDSTKVIKAERTDEEIAQSEKDMIGIRPENDGSKTENGSSSSDEASRNEMNLHHAEILVQGYGKISVVLDAGAAPITVGNFIKLANEGFYNGLTFHRIIDGFMIQGGDPNGDGTGGSDTTIVGEFASNGRDNPISHVRGVISMARSRMPDSASSQFFITVADSTYLDGEYAAFGYVTEGMEFVDQIAREAQPIDSNGTIPREEQPVISSIVIVD
ncbi:MAG: peptidylprolyl isomerase [Eubacteriales bacterium]|nr:peptidylprolyl isomerase [Eubacteriales bacterium]